MSTNAFIDIAIGLVLMYLVLSLVCTSINETLATIVGMRAANLRSSLDKLIDVQNVRDAFYGHGLVDGTNTNRSYVPPLPDQPGAAPATVQGKPATPSYLSGSSFALALLDSLNPDNKAPVEVIADVKQLVSNLPASNLRDLLTSNLALASDDINALRLNIAKSFDQVMDRVSGEYKRQIKLVSFIVGVAVAIALNADSIEVGKALWSDASLRTEMAQNAQQIVAGTTGQCPTAKKDMAEVINKVQCAQSTLRPMPIGWDFSAPVDPTAKNILSKIGGLLFTAIALMLGAPFWFDMLSKFMKIRGTGDKPARTS